MISKSRTIEAGLLAVWSKQGVPKADGLKFNDAGSGLYKADMPVGKQYKSVRLTR